jgi:hypothetical protein
VQIAFPVAEDECPRIPLIFNDKHCNIWSGAKYGDRFGKAVL